MEEIHTCETGYINDPPLWFPDQWEECFRHTDHTYDINIHNLLELYHRAPFDLLEYRDSCVVYQCP